jgi:hypothetical protein
MIRILPILILAACAGSDSAGLYAATYVTGPPDAAAGGSSGAALPDAGQGGAIGGMAGSGGSQAGGSAGSLGGAGPGGITSAGGAPGQGGSVGGSGPGGATSAGGSAGQGGATVAPIDAGPEAAPLCAPFVPIPGQYCAHAALSAVSFTCDPAAKIERTCCDTLNAAGQALGDITIAKIRGRCWGFLTDCLYKCTQ